MPSYNFGTQIVVVGARMIIHNFVKKNGQLDEGLGITKEEYDDEIEMHKGNS